MILEPGSFFPGWATLIQLVQQLPYKYIQNTSTCNDPILMLTQLESVIPRIPIFKIINLPIHFCLGLFSIENIFLQWSIPFLISNIYTTDNHICRKIWFIYMLHRFIKTWLFNVTLYHDFNDDCFNFRNISPQIN